MASSEDPGITIFLMIRYDYSGEDKALLMKSLTSQIFSFTMNYLSDR